MSSMPIVDFLTKQIFIERNVVTYRSLSRELRLHVNTAKNELAIYHENAPYRSQTSCATYLVCGEIDPSYVDDMNMDYGEGKDAEGDFEDDGDDVPQTKLLLVNEPDLEDAKSQFTRINSIHIYSLSPSPLRDAGHICTPTEHVRAADRGKDAKEMIQIVGKIVGANIKIVQSTLRGAKLTRQPVAGPSRSKPTSRSTPAEAKEKEASTEPKEQNKITVDKPKDKPKATGKLDFSKAKIKEKKSDTSTEAAKGKKEKAVKEELKENKEKEKEKEEPVSVKTQQPKKATEPAKRGTKRKSALQVSDSEEESEQPPKVVSRHASPLPNAKENVRVKGRALISDDEEDEVTKPVRKPRKGRAAAAVDSDNEEVLAMMDIDDDQVTRVSRDNHAESKVDQEQNDDGEEEEEKPAAADEDVDMDDVTIPKAKPKKRAPKKVIPVGKNGLKKRRVVKSRNRVDEKGYMVFEDYSEYESVDEEEEPEPKRAKGKAKAKAKMEQESDDESAPAAKPKPNTKAAVQKEPLKAKGAKSGTGGAKGGQKQGSLAGFFISKPKK